MRNAIYCKLLVTSTPIDVGCQEIQDAVEISKVVIPMCGFPFIFRVMLSIVILTAVPSLISLAFDSACIWGHRVCRIGWDNDSIFVSI